VTQLQTQQKQLDALQRENHIYEQRFDRLQSELGTANVSRIVALVQSLQSEAGVALEEIRPVSSAADDNPEYGLDIEAASPFVDADTLSRLGDMSADERDALDVGVVRLSDDGTVEALNEAALQLPGLSNVENRDAVLGKNFFLELAPSTNNNLFYGRFQEAKKRGTIDARFPYTFTNLGEQPQSFAVHLYRTPDSTATWLLYQPT
jgi:photoactive yellow protein